jgi:Trypsin-co-occurring domain 1
MPPSKDATSSWWLLRRLVDQTELEHRRELPEVVRVQHGQRVVLASDAAFTAPNGRLPPLAQSRRRVDECRARGHERPERTAWHEAGRTAPTRTGYGKSCGPTCRSVSHDRELRLHNRLCRVTLSWSSAEQVAGRTRERSRSGMTQLVSFPLEEGGSVVVEVIDSLAPEPELPDSKGPTRGLRRPQLRDTLAAAGQTLESALGGIQPAAQAIVRTLISGADPPESIEVLFGIQLSGKYGAVFAEASGQANLTVTLSWKRPVDP